MAEQNFRSPNFYEREIDQSAPTVGGPSGTPAGLIGTANKGPAFVPVTVADSDSYTSVFGGLDTNKMGPYAANEWLKNRSALTYLRVLGIGANTTSQQISSTTVSGRVTNAGFRISGSMITTGDKRHNGVVQFITARHSIQTDEGAAMPIFTDNDSRSGAGVMSIVRGVVFLPSSSRLMILDGNASISSTTFVAGGPADVGTVVSGKVKLVVSSTLGSSWSSDDKVAGIRVMTASFDPSSQDYFGKVLNTDPKRFAADQHYLYMDFAVDDELATATHGGIVSGSINKSTDSGETSTMFLNAFGAYDTRFKTPKSPWIISQPFGTVEHDLFCFEALDDGEYANKLYKISIANLKMSEDESNPYGTFTVNVRDWNDTDVNPVVIETFPNCTLDPTSENYVAKLVGDRKVYFNFDATVDTERRLVVAGIYKNMSKYVRIVMNEKVDRGLVPQKSLPFGFRGLSVLKTNDKLTDSSTAPFTSRLAGVLGSSVGSSLTGSILPPIPMRYKVTKGEALPFASQVFSGQASNSEIVSPMFHWGVKFERNNLPLNPNIVVEQNNLLASLTKFQGIKELDTLVTGSGADQLNNNKFTLARVALPNTSVSDVTSSVNTHMKDACYIRNGKLDSTTYTITDGAWGNRVTFATLCAQSSPITFNRFQSFAKFTTFLGGGFDGLNILDNSSVLMNDRSVSFDTGGAALGTYIPTGFNANQNGTTQSNANVIAYKAAIDIMTDSMTVSHNVLAIPGIEESFITDYAIAKTKEYGMAIYIMDIPGYDESLTRLYADQNTRPDVDKTASTFAGRSIDNSFGATYWPPVFIDDKTNKRRVKVPASVAVMSALGFNDKVAYPWFAPAGFNRAALDMVTNVTVRLNVTDRDTLQDQRINPIATFPKLGYVIYGQKTLQIAKTALNRVNARRMLLEVKRVVISIAQKMVFEQSTPEVWNKFVADSSIQLAMIQLTAGIESFKVVMNETNNTKEDIDQNKVNGKIVVVPTKSFEFIAIDFIISPSGVSFV